ncbi:single-stranded DNA-binding protein [Nonomuraea rhizosphaerae]|uniref:single-stranded DNA-binding protein n=1 Tax=Nonomuraea rhizosphaerae TaxID=2665663 RepID=UPI001C5FEB3A|nr:single-stranded DNA-binding protein [Nonomuraea rhizosphaerae]
MNDIHITLTGNVAAEPRQYSFEDGAKVTSLRVLTTHRYFDKRTGQWTDGERVCFAVRCWRSLGENVARSVQVGQPVVVSGKLRIREFGPEGDRRFMPEVEASAVGHDLRWGTGVFAKPERTGGPVSVSKEMRDRLDEETQDWALGVKPARDHTRAIEPTQAANPQSRPITHPAPLTEDSPWPAPLLPEATPVIKATHPTSDQALPTSQNTNVITNTPIASTDHPQSPETPLTAANAPQNTTTALSTSTPQLQSSQQPTPTPPTTTSPANSTPEATSSTATQPTTPAKNTPQATPRSTSTPSSRSSRRSSAAASPPSTRTSDTTVRIVGADNNESAAEERAAA